MNDIVRKIQHNGYIIELYSWNLSTSSYLHIRMYKDCFLGSMFHSVLDTANLSNVTLKQAATEKLSDNIIVGIAFNLIVRPQTHIFSHFFNSDHYIEQITINDCLTTRLKSI